MTGTSRWGDEGRRFYVRNQVNYTGIWFVFKFWVVASCWVGECRSALKRSVKGMEMEVEDDRKDSSSLFGG